MADEEEKVVNQESSVDSPDGQYSHTWQVLRKHGAKVVYNAFDHEEGVEVAWHEMPHPPVETPEDAASFEFGWKILAEMGKEAKEYRRQRMSAAMDDDSDASDLSYESYSTEEEAEEGTEGKDGDGDDKEGGKDGQKDGDGAENNAGEKEGSGDAQPSQEQAKTGGGEGQPKAQGDSASDVPEAIRESMAGGTGSTDRSDPEAAAAAADGTPSDANNTNNNDDNNEQDTETAVTPSTTTTVHKTRRRHRKQGRSMDFRRKDREGEGGAEGGEGAEGDVPHQRQPTRRERLKGWEFSHLEVMLDSWQQEDEKKLVYITESTGTSLETYLENIRVSGTRLHLRVARKWARQILSALRFLNSRDPPIVHGSLFSDNLYVNPEQGVLKIGNLENGFYVGADGVLRPFFKGDHSGVAASFSSPEALESPSSMSKLADIWTFGVVFLELVTGRPAFAECESLQQQWNKASRGEMPDLLSLILDRDIRDFIARCLGPVGTRPSAEELLNDPLMDDRFHLGPARDGAPVQMDSAEAREAANAKKHQEDEAGQAQDDETGKAQDATDAAARGGRSKRPSAEGQAQLPLEGRTVMIVGVDEYTLALAASLSNLGAILVICAVMPSSSECEEELTRLSKEITANGRQIFRHDVDIVREGQGEDPDATAFALFKWTLKRVKTVHDVVISVMPQHGISSNREASMHQTTFMRIAKAMFHVVKHKPPSLLVITTGPDGNDTRFLPHHCATAAIREATRRLRDTYPKTNSVYANLVDNSHCFTPAEDLVVMCVALIQAEASMGSEVRVSTMIKQPKS